MQQIHALAIDDNLQNLRVLGRLLSKEGIDCVEVSNPTSLVKLLSTLHHVDVIFLDLEMPGMDGYVAKKLLRSHFQDARIVAYTVHISEINVVRSNGFDGFIGKPLDNTRFPQQLSRILNGEGVWERT